MDKRFWKWLIIFAVAGGGGLFAMYQMKPPKPLPERFHAAEGADSAAALAFCEKMRELGKECIVGSEGFDSISPE